MLTEKQKSRNKLRNANKFFGSLIADSKTFWMHSRGMDCVIEVLGVIRVGTKGTVAWVNWWNLGVTGSPWKILTQKMYIKAAEYPNWRPMSHQEFLTPRGVG